MQSLETYRLFLLRDKGQGHSTAELNLKLMRCVLREALPLSVETFSAFITKLIDLERKPKYINQYIVAVHYWGQVFLIPDLASYPFYERRDRDEYVRATMTDDEVEAFLSLPNPNPIGTVYWQRFELWTMFWSICAYHGPRMGEVARMRKVPTKDNQSTVDFGANVIIFDGKTGPRKVPMSFVVRDKLKYYVDTLVKGEYLFPSLHSYAKSPYVHDVAWGGDFRHRIQELEPKFPGISNRMNLEPYSLRHTAGTRWAEEDWALPKIQKAMGHRRLDTTQKYLHMSMKGVTEMIDNDRLSIPHKRGIDIIQTLVDDLQKAEKKFRKKIFIDIRKKNRNTNSYIVRLEAIDA